MVDVLKKLAATCPMQYNIRFQIEKKERSLHLKNKRSFSRLTRTCFRVSCQWLKIRYFGEKSHSTYKGHLLCLRTYLLKKGNVIKISVFDTYQMYVVLLNFNKKHKSCLIKGGYSPVAFLRIETQNIENMKNANIEGLPEQYMATLGRRYRVLKTRYKYYALQTVKRREGIFWINLLA